MPAGLPDWLCRPTDLSASRGALPARGGRRRARRFFGLALVALGEQMRCVDLYGEGDGRGYFVDDRPLRERALPLRLIDVGRHLREGVPIPACERVAHARDDRASSRRLHDEHRRPVAPAPRVEDHVPGGLERNVVAHLEPDLAHICVRRGARELLGDVRAMLVVVYAGQRCLARLLRRLA
ncbi:hypothetical protein T492DRAFT_1036012 [Pavlovales sp. CCMP2436]|nr:hypothetical protein T492DRAFT_1036012 [Pavlovales sp. CCMP2436]